MFLFLLLQSPPTETPFEKWIYAVLLAVVSGLIAWFAARRQNRANAGKTEAEIVGVWQEKYFGLLDKLEDLRDKSEEVETELDEAKGKLRNCLSDKGDCRELIKNINPIFTKTENALKELIEHAPLLAEIQTMRDEISRKIAS